MSLVASFKSLQALDILAALVLALVIIGWITRSRRRCTTPLNGPTSESWLLGLSKILFTSEDSSKLHTEWAEKYGPAYSVPLQMGQKSIFLCDIKACSYFLSKDSWGYQQLPMERAMLERFVGKGLIWAQGESHKRQRKALVPAFSTASIRKLMEYFYLSAYKVKGHWDTSILQSGSDEAVIDVEEWMNKISLDGLGNAAFSHDFGTLDTNDSEVYDAFESLASSDFGPWTILVTILSYFFPPAYHIPHKGASDRNRFGVLSRKVAEHLIRQERQNASEGIDDKSILGLLLASERSVSQSKRTTPDEVLAQIQTFAIAGYLTTSTTLTWCLIELCRNPRVQVALRNELKKNFPGKDPSWDDFSSLPYLDAVLLETLRLHPPLPEIMRVAMEDDVIPFACSVTTASGEVVSSITIAKGTQVIGCIGYLNRSKDIWGADADQFLPERWLNLENCNLKAKEIQGHKHLMSFSDGPRICLGKNFSIAEMKATLSVLIKYYHVEFDGGKDPGIVQHIALMKRPKAQGREKAEVPLKIRRIEE